MHLPRLNWKVNLTCYKNGEKGHLAREWTHIRNAAITQNHSAQTITACQTTPPGPTF